MSGLGQMRLGWRVLRAEGLRAVGERIHDRRLDEHRRNSFVEIEPERLRPLAPCPGVINVLPCPPHRRLGGLPQQFLARLEAEGAERAIALLYPDSEAWRLEIESAGRRFALHFPRPTAPPTDLFGPGFEAAVSAASRILGVKWIHVESVSGLPLGSLLRLRQSGLRVIVTAHDFGFFCARPNLLEQPMQRFCDYSTDLRRCAACLQDTWSLAPQYQEERRGCGQQILEGAEAAIYPSDFLRRQHAQLFPGLAAARQHVIPPGGLVQESISAGAASVRRPPHHVAFVGSVEPHKGARVFAEIVRRLSAAGDCPWRWSAYGGGDRDLLRRLRRLRVHVRGYYRAGSLPRTLRRHRVDLALLLSVVPESYGLALDECLLAGVGVLAFRHGALGDRVAELGAGLLVEPAAGAEGVVEALRGIARGEPLLPATVTGRGGSAGAAAAAHLRLYRELGVL